MPKINNYKATDIKVLEGLEPVRKRPGMYIGSTDSKGLHHLAKEILDNAVDEAIAGYGKAIQLYRTKVSEELIKFSKTKDMGKQCLTVVDNGRGIPVEMHLSGVSALEVVMTKLHAGGKFEETAYQASGGLHGIGSSAVNALSDFMQVIVKRDNKYYYQAYSKGSPKAKVSEISEEKVVELFPKETTKFITYETGTLVSFIPDTTIFSTTNFNYQTIIQIVKDRAYLMAGISFEFYDDIKKTSQHFYFEGGIRSLVEHLNLNKKSLHKVFHTDGMWEDAEIQKKIGVEIALQYNDSYHEKLDSYVNVINTPDGGTHINGFRSALGNVLRTYANDHKLIKDNESFVQDDMREGLTAVVFVRMSANDLQFESQTKAKLNNSEAQSAVYQVFKEAFTTFLEENPKAGKKIIEKIMLSSRARMAARAAKDAVIRKGLLEGSSLPGKLADCQSRKAEESEIYIVEGDSAGGCFSGNTKIALTDGRNLNFKQIIKEQKQGKKHFCYSIRKDGTVGLEQIINPRRTKQNAQVVKITLDNNEKITCTPNHKFLLRNGQYKEAAKLTLNDSLMPLYKKISDINDKNITINGYEMVWDPRSDSWAFTHVLADRYNRWKKIYKKIDGNHCHHCDFNKYNNNPDNIIRISANDHLDLHRKQVSKTLHRPEVIAKCKKIRQSQVFRKKMSQLMKTPAMKKMLSQRAKKQWSNPNYKNYMKIKWQEFYTNNVDYRKTNNEQLYKAQQKYWAKAENRLTQANRVKNFFIKNPQFKQFLSKKALEQWKNTDLIAWRSQTTKKDKSLLRFDTFINKYFGGETSLALETVANYNHKISSIKTLKKKIDVYDIEVPHTHNFALASGVFVHNSAKQGRDRKFQAIFPLRGKILNTERARLDKVVAFEELKNLVIALGAGIGETFNEEKLRYHRIILMNDADVDGEHITTLGLTFFFRHMPEIVKQGYLYVAMPPLYKITSGKTLEYAYSDEERDEMMAAIKKKNPNAKISLQRYKGLGEMNPDQLWETTMNPETRILKKMTIDDAEKADHTFSVLMGDDVPPRKKFIQTHAQLAELDV